jgi:hypothetical protein
MKGLQRVRLRASLTLLVLLAAMANVVWAEGPTINWEALQSYAILAVKLAVTATGTLVFAAALIRAAIAALRKHVSGSVAAAAAQRELYEAIEGPLLWLVALALAAWLPDILVAIGLLPSSTPFAVKWEDIFRKP